MDTVALRLSKYQRRLRLQAVVAATILAQVTVFSAVKFSEGELGRSGPLAVSGAVFLTLVVVAGVLLALARGALEWQADLLSRNLPQVPGAPAPLDTNMTMDIAANNVQGLSSAWPRRDRLMYPLTLFIVLLLGLLLVAYFWLPVVSRPRAPEIRPRVEIIHVPVSVHFDVDRAVVPLTIQPQIEILARELLRAPNLAVQLDGHADSDGRSGYNLELSRSRAEAVKTLLVANGVEAKRITVLAHGETRPLSTYTSPSGKAQNRRVDINLIDSTPRQTGAPDKSVAPGSELRR